MTPDEVEQDAARAESLLNLGDVAGAETIYQAIFQATPKSQSLAAGTAVGVCLARRRQWQAAREHFTRLHADFPGNGLLLAYRGAAKAELADFDDARDDLDAAADQSPDDGVVFIKRAELFHRFGLLRQAAADFQHALLVSLPDAATRDFCRQALLKVRAELKTSVERNPPTIANPFRKFSRKGARIKSVESLPLSVGRIS